MHENNASKLASIRMVRRDVPTYIIQILYQQAGRYVPKFASCIDILFVPSELPPQVVWQVVSQRLLDGLLHSDQPTEYPVFSLFVDAVE